MNIQSIVVDWLHTEAPSRAPERLLSVTLDRAAETPQQRVLWRREPQDRSRSSRPLFVLATALVGTSLIGTLAILGAPNQAPQPIQTSGNGWVAFTSGSSDASLTTDIYIVREGQPARRIVGSDADGVDQRCPAFAPDGARLAYGRAEGSDYGELGHTGAALVIADLDARGDPATAMEIEVGGTYRPPCAIWSPDGRNLAFAVGRSVDSIEGGFTTTSTEVWIVRLDDRQITPVQDVFATDLEWSPDSSQLAIASGEQLLGHNADLTGAEIRLYSVGSGVTRTLPGTRGANWVTWSPDGSRIAYERSLERPDATGRVDEHRELVVHELEGDAEQVLASGYITNHGIGPVWSPNGDQIVYQRICDQNWEVRNVCREEHDVVVLTAGRGSSWQPWDVTETVMPQSFRQGETKRALWPFRVTWSPDGQSLLYVTFGNVCPACAEGYQGSYPSALVVVPTSSDLTPMVLAEGDGIDAEVSGLVVPIQVWGRQPDRYHASPIPD